MNLSRSLNSLYLYIICTLGRPNLLQSSHSPSPCSTSTQRKERFTRRHSVNVLPLLPDADERDEPANRAAKRVTMDFSLLAAPLPDLQLDGGNGKAAAGRRVAGTLEENTPIQVLCLCTATAFPTLSIYTCCCSISILDSFFLFGLFVCRAPAL